MYSTSDWLDKHPFFLELLAVSALLFLYRSVLQIDLRYINGIERAKRSERLPRGLVFLRHVDR